MFSLLKYTLFLFYAKTIPLIKDCCFCKFMTSKVPIFTLNKYHCQSPIWETTVVGQVKPENCILEVFQPYKTTKTVVITDNFMYVPPPAPYLCPGCQLATCCQGRGKEQLSQQQLAEKQSYFLAILAITGWHFPNSVSLLVRNISSIFLSEHLATLQWKP